MEIPANAQPGTQLKLTVLYVEDDSDTRSLLSLYLKRRIRTLVTAGDGEEGLAVFLRSQPQLVVTDIRMPIMDGLEMSVKIRAHAPAIPIIITSAYNDQDYHEKMMALGLDAILAKPINPADLMDNILRLTRARNLEARD